MSGASPEDILFAVSAKFPGRGLAIALATIVTSVAGCGVVPLPSGLSDPTAPPPLRAQDAEFRTLVGHWFDLWSEDEGVARGAESIFATDSDALVHDLSGPLSGRFGAEARSSSLRRAARASFTKFNVTPLEGIRLRRSGDRAITSTTFRATFEAGGHAADADGRTSLIWERREGRWLVVHEHTSVPLLDDWLGGATVEPVSLDADWTMPRDPEFQRIVDEYLRAVSDSRSSDATRSDLPVRFFEPGEDVVIWDPSSRRALLGWGAVAAHRDAVDLRVYLTNKQSRGDVRAWRRGDMAWVSFTFTARATRRDGERFTLVGRQTDVFQKRAGEWRIVHEHASMPITADGTPGGPATTPLVIVPPRTSRSIPQLPKLATSPLAIDASSDRALFHDLVARCCESWSSRAGKLDVEEATASYSPDAGLAFIDSIRGQRFTSRARLAAARADIAEQTIRPRDDLVVVRSGDMAWTTNTQERSTVSQDGRREEVVQVQTAIWQRRDGRWWIVHEHVSQAP